MTRPNGVHILLFSVLIVSVIDIGSGIEERNYRRPVPLNGFKRYNGGYNVTDKHYLASVAFTGVHGYAIAGIWFVFGVGFGVYLASKLRRRRSNSDSSDHFSSSHDKCFFHEYDRFLLFIIVLLTILALVSNSLILDASGSSLRRIRKVKAEIEGIGKTTHRTIHRLIIAMTNIQKMLVPYNPGVALKLYNYTHVLANESATIRHFVDTSTHSIDRLADASKILHNAVVSMSMVFLFFSIASLLFRWPPGLITVIIVCWLLTTICWTLAGFDFFFHTLSEDTCMEFENFEKNPQNSSLSLMIRCINPLYSDSLLAEVGSTIHSFIFALNAKVTELYALLATEGQGELGRFGSGKICDPFSKAPEYTYNPDSCPDHSLQLDDLPDIISDLTCYKENSTEACISQGRVLPEAFSGIALAYSHSLDQMIEIYPDLRDLTKCAFVKTTFSDMVNRHCRPLRASTRFLWLSVLCLSITMEMLVLVWVARTYHEVIHKGFTSWSLPTFAT